MTNWNNKDKEKQSDLFGLDEKEKRILASYKSPKNQVERLLRKKIKEQQKNPLKTIFKF